MEAVHAVMIGDGAVKLHAGDDQHAAFRQVVLVVIGAVIGQRQKIIAVLRMHGDYFLGGAFAIRTGGMAVQTALEQGVFALKSRLPKHRKSLLWYDNELNRGHCSIGGAKRQCSGQNFSAVRQDGN